MRNRTIKKKLSCNIREKILDYQNKKERLKLR